MKQVSEPSAKEPGGFAWPRPSHACIITATRQSPLSKAELMKILVSVGGYDTALVNTVCLYALKLSFSRCLLPTVLSRFSQLVPYTLFTRSDSLKPEKSGA
ncbi:hypothetical protein DPX16_9961 [Anabarilius grahami]|uniref:Uncharacterized protein n=1 Tax=Anabarilius grahami TaxID=495550 RepID=A0A3N0XX05_ANAGA|nr:hypothetical protein DPX16_9961 [Anabarilius grahami]